MTREELKDAILADMNMDYYSSALCVNLANFEYIELDSMPRTRIEEDILRLIEDLADCCMETMENNGVLKAKKQEHEIKT